MEDNIRYARLRDNLATRQTFARHGDPIPEELTEEINSDILVLERKCGIPLAPQLLRGDDQERAEGIGEKLAQRGREAA